MRDSNARGREPNALSKSDAGCSPVAVPVLTCGVTSVALRREQARAGVNETRNETRQDRLAASHDHDTVSCDTTRTSIRDRQTPGAQRCRS
jgi:hypothetical protein